MNGFTPGPWQNDNTGKVYSKHVIRKNGVIICSINMSFNSPGTAEAEANARLITAAPMLVASLQWALGHIKVPALREDAPWIWDELDKARALLAEIEGGPNHANPTPRI